MVTIKNDDLSFIKRHTNALYSSVIQPLSMVLEPFFTKYPYWGLAFYQAIGLYGYYMALKQEEVNEIVIFIKEHPNEFRKEIVDSEEFQNGFILFLEQYLKQRIDKKKEVLKTLFLGFTNTKDKQNYEFERLNDCLVRMSLDSLNFLIFLQKEILPSINREIIEELKKDQYQKSDRSLEWWHNNMLLERSIWLPLEKWLYDNFDPKTDKVKKDYGQALNAGWIPEIQHKANTREKEERRKKHECVVELVSLGVIRSLATSGGIGSGTSNDYRLTQFGITFINSSISIKNNS